MKNGTPIKGKKGWVHFGAGQIREFEYKKYLQEQKDKEKAKNKTVKDVERERKREQRKHKNYLEGIRKKIAEFDIDLARISNIENAPEEEVLEVIEKTLKINESLLKGEGILDTALAVGMTREMLTTFLRKYYKANSPTSYKKKLESRHMEIERPWGGKEKREVRHYISVPFESYADRLKARADPIVSTEAKSYGSRLYPRAELGLRFSKNISIIPERTLQPIKRTRVAAHSFLTAGKWHNKTSLLSTSCKLAEKDEDKYLTSEGGVIISRKFALKEDIGLGDKILGIYGLKGIVSEIRKQSYDIIINKNQVWGAKISRLCGGAVFDVLAGKIQIFYQPDHKVQRNIPVDKKPRVNFSPDLVPFLAHYLSFHELVALQGENKKRFQDVLYMLNLEFYSENGDLHLEPKLTQPEERRGGKLIPYGGTIAGKVKWEKGFEKEKIDMGPAIGLKYPFILKNIWMPDWFLKENKYSDKNGKTRHSRFIENLFDCPERVFLGMEGPGLLSKFLFSQINESLSYLTAIAKNSKANEIFLNSTDCEVNEINDGDWILVFRPPVVDRLNIQKMQVKIADIPRATTGINVESIRLMHGDFDGDHLYLIKIPQTTRFARMFEVSVEKYEDERKAIFEEIKENDAVKLPKDERKVKIAQVEAFYQEKVDAGDWQPKKLEILGKKLATKPTGQIRTDDELIEEGRVIHDNLNASGTRAAAIGVATKKMWLGSEHVKEEDISAIASLEIIKDRADKDSDKKYKESLATLKKYEKELQTILLASGKKVTPRQTRAFEKLITVGTFKKDADKVTFPNLSKLKSGPIIRSRTPYAKFILCLCKEEKRKTKKARP